jgi:hypothetical protein
MLAEGNPAIMKSSIMGLPYCKEAQANHMQRIHRERGIYLANSHSFLLSSQELCMKKAPCTANYSRHQVERNSTGSIN